MSGTSDEFDLEETQWVPGVDYVGGWRDAKDACDELLAAVSDTWPEAEDVTASAQSVSDGSALIHLRIPPTTARKLATLIRITAGDSNNRRTEP
ncbi:hypothetical protein [Actinacidiphila bryophytorum]|uniref:Uncharacterized protein n=1 Tax=Actinacidiphila bryophytorum TaxID=1436133 RepID=A0A9W4GZY0_9ACTN|nr:hypothetical protein [Actinacidiphila bryophytorum]MBM9436064.1 hypothetical protein [Actinacidiphila bryophytorum]MBN6542136.1 hypothetical protein [Actinacidiphila bryophytorum]CAG7634746.1 conserved hypothetical protein [Actinacidiphila bryophytorum]